MGRIAMRSLSPELLAQLYSRESNDPFVILLTLSHASFPSDIQLVNNSVNLVSRGKTFQAFPFKLTLPADDGETAREFRIEFDNTSLELIDEIRSVTSQISVTIEMILTSIPDDVQISVTELKIQSIQYNKNRVTASLYMDNFLGTELTSERYYPSNFPGLF